MDCEDIGTGPTVLAIHGLGGGSYFFRTLAHRLRSTHRIVSVDLPTTPDVSMETWLAELERLILARVDEPVVLLGHSMGTIISLEAWAAWPQHIRGMIFVGGVPRVAPHIHERLSERLRLLASATDLAGWGPRVSPGVFSPATFERLPEVVGAFERLFELQTVEHYMRSCAILLGANAERVLPTVTVPCVAIVGADDQYARPQAVRDFMERAPSARAVEVIPDCGHLPFLEQPQAFADLVRTFLEAC